MRVIEASQLFSSMCGDPAYKGMGRSGGHLSETPVLREGNQSFAITFYLPAPPGWRERQRKACLQLFLLKYFKGGILAYQSHLTVSRASLR